MVYWIILFLGFNYVHVHMVSLLVMSRHVLLQKRPSWLTIRCSAYDQERLTLYQLASIKQVRM